MNNIKKLRETFEYTQEQFAHLMQVGKSTVVLWENGQDSPDFEALKRLSLLFHIPSDFVLGDGIFSKWDQILEYYDAVSFRLQELIPHSLEMPTFTFSNEKFLNPWLDTRRYFEPDEIELARWFAFAIEQIQITPTGEDPVGTKTADVEVIFTPEFKAIIHEEAIKPVDPFIRVVSIAGSDGSLRRYVVKKSQATILRETLDKMEFINDGNV